MLDNTNTDGTKSRLSTNPAVLDFIAVVQCDYSEPDGRFLGDGFLTIHHMHVSGFDIRIHLHKILRNVPIDGAKYIVRKNGDGTESQFKAGDPRTFI